MLDDELNNQKNEVDSAPSAPTTNTDIASLVNDVRGFQIKAKQPWEGYDDVDKAAWNTHKGEQDGLRWDQKVSRSWRE